MGIRAEESIRRAKRLTQTILKNIGIGITSPFLIGSNGKYGITSSKTTFHIAHYMTKDLTELDVLFAHFYPINNIKSINNNGLNTTMLLKRP